MCVWRSFMRCVWGIHCRLYFQLNRVVTLFLCLEIICERMPEQWIALTIVYLNDLSKNNYPSSAEVLEGKGHTFSIIPNHLALSQAHKSFVGENIEKKFLEIMNILDLDWTSKLGCPLITKLFTHIIVCSAQDRTLRLKGRMFLACFPHLSCYRWGHAIWKLQARRLETLEILQGFLLMSPDVPSFIQGTGVLLPEARVVFSAILIRSMWTCQSNLSREEFLQRVGFREWVCWGNGECDYLFRKYWELF